jgi:cyclopropane fatty-acyl-phospholipid synthase-like methyltransferase/ABC-type nitrate/sulfonate/bicarbonate transport system substrate-binding protein
MKNLAIRVGGVPEHFNFPWQLGLERGLFSQAGFDLQWQDFPGGTGAMCQALREGELDLALVLTEGAVAELSRHNHSLILGTYVRSPLGWGIHVAANSPVQQLEALAQGSFAISRPGSGSHLMAAALAEREGWDQAPLTFEPVGTLEGAITSMGKNAQQLFLWEKYTTQPYVDRGAIRRLGVLRPDWPAFVIMVRRDFLACHEARLGELLAVVRQAHSLLPEPERLTYIGERYQLDRDQVAEWYQETRWQIEPRIAFRDLERVGQLLVDWQLIDQQPDPEAICPYLGPPLALSDTMYDWRVESVRRMLARQGKAEGPLSVADLVALGHLDQYHYLGEETCQEVVKALGLGPEDHVCDIGSGVGGTSRVIAEASGCRVTGIELQPQLNALATELTERVGLGERVSFQTVDFALGTSFPGTFDAFVSLLVYLHLPDLPGALHRSQQLLKPGGRFFIEDLTLLRYPSKEAVRLMDDVLSAYTLTSPGEYPLKVRDARLVVEEVVDMTAAWRDWTAQRLADFEAHMEDYEGIFSPELLAQRRTFYATVSQLFAEGYLGGIRLVGHRPL